ncbi:DUF4328 domain-containing protein [Streptomyces lasiicapitis]|uniref:DUF4328 domain-containing protein n=1 Tax=Streptomyces lasiicapitis TaxID=1923961 RepID=UPI00332456E1
MSYTPPSMPVAPPPPSAPGPGAWLKSPVGLANGTVALLGVGIATDLFSLWAGGGVFGVVSDLIDGGLGTVTEDRADRADSLYAASGVFQVAALVGTAVLFLCWFRRVRVNAEVFAPDGHSMSRGWAVGAWFVPVANLWFPRRVAVDIWDASSEGRWLPGGDPQAGRRTLLNAWWTLWITSSVFGWIASQQYRKAEEPEKIKNAVVSLMASDLLSIAAAVLAILFVRRLTAMQGAKARSGPGSPTHA